MGLFLFSCLLAIAMSSALVWEIVKSNNSFLVKRNGIQFSREAGNLTNKNAFKYSGLANAKTVGVKVVNKTPALVKKSRTNSRKPKKAHPVMALKGTARQNAKVISAETVGKHYRPDLEKAALARLTRVSQSLKPAKAITKRPRNRGKKVAKPAAAPAATA